MQLALALAARGKGFTSPNPCVGAVVVKNGEVVGEGWHRAFGADHAEVMAINHAGDAARGADLFVTLEPCNHFGKTPPCTHKILRAGIRRVVAACPDPNPKAAGGLEFLAQNGVDVSCGLLQVEAETLIEDFLWYVRHHTPFVILSAPPLWTVALPLPRVTPSGSPVKNPGPSGMKSGARWMPSWWVPEPCMPTILL